MLMLTLKYYYRTGLFLAPILILPIVMINIWKNIDISVLAPILLQQYFYRMNENNYIGKTLVRITNFKISRLYKLLNISFLFWLNVWYIVGLVIMEFLQPLPFIDTFTKYVSFNSLIFFSFIIGNIIDNSDLLSIKNKIIQLILSSFIFTTAIIFYIVLIKAISFFPFSLLFTVIILLLVIIVWYKIVNTYTTYKFFKYTI